MDPCLPEILKKMTINEIGVVIANDWKKPSHSAVPYISAMQDITDGKYFLDSWDDIVIRFLCNASLWKGETARTVKEELKWRTKNMKMLR